VLVYHVTPDAALEPAAEIALQGRPVAMAAAGDLLVILQRPPGDDKHLGPGWWEAVRLDGERRGLRVPAGYYPDDLAVTPDGRFVLVLNSGQAEGDRKKPLPGLDVYPTPRNLEADRPDSVGHLSLEPKDDADRLILSASGMRGVITLPKARQAVALDLTSPEDPRVAGRSELPDAAAPYLSRSEDGDCIVMPTVAEHEAVAIEAPADRHPTGKPDLPAGCLVYTMPEDSALELARSTPRLTLGRFPLKGPLNLGGTRPSGLAFCAERSLIAVATKPGTVHLVSIRSRLETDGQVPQTFAPEVGLERPTYDRPLALLRCAASSGWPPWSAQPSGIVPILVSTMAGLAP
jgi:glycerol-3-phosphate acyltransferase PlsY